MGGPTEGDPVDRERAWWGRMGCGQSGQVPWDRGGSQITVRGDSFRLLADTCLSVR